ncbi:SPW repeat protein [Halosolutus amylolyticus]|uniref:SPW repeat protein n=1 Tax=Halosolutus amylolyticus TaxID=2932267 RepID=A0ABD5PP75_9EURY|nr:SPW repeat protein [Halosolutus amylolyticus]
MQDDYSDTTEHDPNAKHDRRREDGQAVTHRDRIEYEPNPDRRGRRLSAFVALLGLWVVGTAVAFDLSAAAVWNDALVGAALIATGAYNYYRRSRRELGSAGVAWFAAILGLWVLVSPFVVGPAPDPAGTGSAIGGWNHVLVGLLAFGAGSYSAMVVRARRKAADARPTATYDRRGQ